jgi:translocation and assembly module TamA
MNIALTDAPNHEFAIGAGFVTDTGPRLRLRWEQPHITDQGHRLATEGKFSAPEQILTAEYRIPLERPLDQSLNFTTSWENKDVQDTQSTIGSVGFFFSNRYNERWTASYGVTYEDESYRQGSAQRQRVNYLAPAININELVLPASIDPTSGHKTWLTLAASNPALGADTSFARITAGRKQLIGLWGSHLLIARVEAGAVTTDDLDDIPSSQRFFTGGDQTVRGYDFESLSPRDANGELTGGKFLNVASLEYSFKILERWRLALFTDSGRAFNSKDEPWHSSVGFGVRWLSPVGQIRVDLAAPIDDDKDGVRLHIFMGPPL